MPRPREYDEATRAALIDAASRRLAAGGDAVTLRDVAADVDATTSAIYALFGGKAELLLEVHRSGFAGLAQELGAVERTDEPLRDLYELGLAYRRSALARPALYTVMFGLRGDDAEAGARSDIAKGTIDRLRQAVARCQAEGALIGDDPAPLAVQLWALVHGLAMLELRGELGDTAAASRHWDEALRAAARGYARS